MRFGMLAVVAVLSGCEKKLCGPYAHMNLPGVTRVERCDERDGVSGETTATPQEILGALRDAGFEAGRNGASGYTLVNRTVFVRKDGATFQLPMAPSSPPSGASRFSLSPETAKLEKWIPEDEWAQVGDPVEEQRHVLAALASLRPLLESGAKAPSTCAEALPAELATGPIINLEWMESGKEAARGVLSEPVRLLARRSASMSAQEALTWSRELRALSAQKIAPFIRVTRYVATSGTGDSTMRFVSGGEADFEVLIVDRAQQRVLCRAAASARIGGKPKPPPKNAPTLVGADGKARPIYFEALTPEDLDLSGKMLEAARATVAQMTVR